ncbi:MAG TPA: RES domain-containing protein [Thermomicrobiaceae bacterium]|nr:RES domain-containing protein [Thermomicrobiaceae bacterium]
MVEHRGALLGTVSVPGPVYRVTHFRNNGFQPAPREYAGSGRFDDPSLLNAPAGSRDEGACFRTVYCSSSRVAAFGETIAAFRQDFTLLARLHEVPDHGAFLEPVDDVLAYAGVVTDDWRTTHVVDEADLDTDLRLVDLAAPATIAHLRAVFAMVALSEWDLREFDSSDLMGRDRRITQTVARYVYFDADEQGQPRYDGLRYPSRLGANWDCFAMFHDRLWGRHTPGFPRSILADDPDLAEAARVLGLRIEFPPGHYVVP